MAGRDAEAAAAYRRAAEHARALFANAEALAHLRSALAVGDPEPGSLHLAIGDLQTLQGEYAAALASYETAAALSPPPSSARSSTGSARSATAAASGRSRPRTSRPRSPRRPRTSSPPARGSAPTCR